MTHDSLMVFDTASLYFRAFFGVPGTMRGPDGTPTNAVRGLLDMMTRLVGQYRPTRLACAWDNDWRPRWRVELVPGYKAQRLASGPGRGAVGAGGVGAESGESEEAPEELRVQVPIIRAVLDAAGVPVVGVDGYEADDVLAGLARHSDVPTLVVTGDRDLFQLAGVDTTIVYVARGVAKHDLVDPAWVQQHYGVPAERYVDFAVLRGDPSDGLPGVRGIGEKSAAQLVASWGGIDAIVAAAADPASAMSPSVRTRIAGAGDYLAAACRVVAVVDDLPVPGRSLRVDDLQHDSDRLAELGRRYGIDGPIGRLMAVLAPGSELQRPTGRRR
ncbi:MAG: 5'-3' exonuclease [Propionibacterium sp.]|nr:5'-3' exonuclease [Propionibacterium sp.]